MNQDLVELSKKLDKIIDKMFDKYDGIDFSWDPDCPNGKSGLDQDNNGYIYYVTASIPIGRINYAYQISTEKKKYNREKMDKACTQLENLLDEA